MPDAPPTVPPLREFRVVCRGDGGTAYIVHRAAPTPGAAMQGAEGAGHEPILCLPFGLSRSEETQIIVRWRSGSAACANCGYSLGGLPGGAYAVCPECGLGSSTGRAGSGGGQPHCSKCGYCMAGIAVGSGPLRCPECGSASPFLENR